MENCALCSFTMDYELSVIVLNVKIKNQLAQIKLQKSDVLSMKQWFDIAELKKEKPELFNQ